MDFTQIIVIVQFVLIFVAWIIVKSAIKETKEYEEILEKRKELIDQLQRDVFDKDDAVNKYRDVLFAKEESVKRLEQIANERYEKANKILEEVKRLTGKP